MALLYADENFPWQVVETLRRLGHDVLTAQEAGQANRAIVDEEVLEFATARARTLLTLNRWEFVRWHARRPAHAGIIACSQDPDVERQGSAIDAAIRAAPTLVGTLLRINRPA